jgi:hypothetical protein
MPSGIPSTMKPKKKLSLILKCKKQNNGKSTNDSHKTASTTFPGIFSSANLTKAKNPAIAIVKNPILNPVVFSRGDAFIVNVLAQLRYDCLS